MACITTYLLYANIVGVFSAITIIRDEVDGIANVSRKTCYDFKGTYKEGKCQCPRTAPTFISKDNRQPFCADLVSQDCVAIQPEKATMITNSSCKHENIKSLFVWNSEKYKNVEFGSWVEVTKKSLSYFVEDLGSFRFRITINEYEMLLDSQLMKIELQCDKTCYFLKRIGMITYPLNPLIYGLHAHLHTTERTLLHSSSGLRVGIVVLVVGVTSFIVAVLFTALHTFRHRLKKCVQRNHNDSIINMDDIIPRDTQTINVENIPGNRTILLEDTEENAYDSKNHSPVPKTDSEFASLERLDNSQYSAISPSRSEASIKRGMENSSWENTPNQRGENSERNRLPIYDELLALPPDRYAISPRCTKF